MKNGGSFATVFSALWGDFWGIFGIFGIPNRHPENPFCHSRPFFENLFHGGFLILIADNTPFAGTGVPTTAPGKSLHCVGTDGLSFGLGYIVGVDVHGDPFSPTRE